MRINSRLVTIPAALMLTALTSSANAASATTQVNMVMRVMPDAPKCSVASSAASFNLPSASSTTTLAEYLASAGFNMPANSARNASSNYNQTATISCAQLTTPITSVSVEPATPGNRAGAGYLIDKDGSRAFDGHLQVAAEIVSTTNLTGSSGSSAFPALQKAPATLASGNIQVASNEADAKTPFDASFVWRPTVLATDDNASSNQKSVFGAAAGGVYETKYVVTVNY